MHIRKLVRSGHSSLVVAVPQNWIRTNNLKPGALIYLDELNGSLVMKTDSRESPPAKSDTVIDVDGLPVRRISREIISAYLNNFHHIVIKGAELRKKSKAIKKMISYLIALELIEECSDKIVAQSFLNIYDAEPCVILRRMDNIIRSMILDVKQHPADHDMAADLMERDMEVNRLNYLVSKVLKMATKDKSVMSALGLSSLDILRYWEVNGTIEKIGDRVKNIAQLMADMEPSHKAKFVELFLGIEEMYKDVMKSFYESSVKLSDSISARRVIINDHIERFLQETNCPLCSQVAINAFTITGNINDIGRMVRYMD